ncbi:MAG TPA: hypothetical protein VGB85_18930 [Nannocystis sp.]|jgi:hypothetical protein
MLSAAFGCTIDLGGGTSTSTTDGPTTEPDTTADTTTGTPTTGAPTTGVTATDTGTTDTGSDPAWCNGFDPKAAGLTVHNNDDVPLMNGSDLAAECGGQGIIMIPIFPHFGGFVPAGDAVTFDVVLDVDGFNIGPGDHFFAATGLSHQVDCGDEDTYGYYFGSYAFIPMFPPDGVPDINLIDGKAGHLSLTLHTPDGDVPFAADVVMKAQIDACGYGGYETSDYDDTDSDSTSDSTSGSTSGSTG